MSNYGVNEGDNDSKGLELKPEPFPAHFQLLACNPDGKKAHLKKKKSSLSKAGQLAAEAIRSGKAPQGICLI